MKKILMLYILLSGLVFYSINKNADLLKKAFANTSNISSYNESTEKEEFQFTNHSFSEQNNSPESNESKKLICIQVDGIFYCHES